MPPRNKAAQRKLEKITDFKDLPLDVFLIRSKEHQQPQISGLRVKGISDALPQADHKYRMVVTKGHYERTEMVKLPDPFKKHTINNETRKKEKVKKEI